MVFLLIKEIAPGNDEVIIVTSSLMKDMNSKVCADAALGPRPKGPQQEPSPRRPPVRHTSSPPPVKLAMARLGSAIASPRPRRPSHPTTPQVDLYRANAVRVLCQIVDTQLLGQIERYLKQVGAGVGACLTTSSWARGASCGPAAPPESAAVERAAARCRSGGAAASLPTAPPPHFTCTRAGGGGQEPRRGQRGAGQRAAPD